MALELATAQMQVTIPDYYDSMKRGSLACKILFSHF